MIPTTYMIRVGVQIRFTSNQDRGTWRAVCSVARRRSDVRKSMSKERIMRPNAHRRLLHTISRAREFARRVYTIVMKFNVKLHCFNVIMTVSFFRVCRKLFMIFFFPIYLFNINVGIIQVLTYFFFFFFVILHSCRQGYEVIALKKLQMLEKKNTLKNCKICSKNIQI